MIIGKFESIPIQFRNLVVWKPENIANFSTFLVTYDCRKQRNFDEMIPENDRQNTYTPKILKYSYTHMHCESPAFGTTPACVHQMHVYVDFCIIIWKMPEFPSFLTIELCREMSSAFDGGHPRLLHVIGPYSDLRVCNVICLLCR